MKLLPVAFLAVAANLFVQELPPGNLQHPAANTWPTYNGDYSGRRYSTLRDVNSSNIGSLAPQWIYHIDVGAQRGVGAPQIKSTPLVVGGVLYFTIPDHVWALDARTGEQIWHYAWQDTGGHLVGNRGVGMYGAWLYFLSPDGWLICLNAKNGQERWRREVADHKLQYFTTMAPVIVDNRVIVGVGGDAMDVPGFLESRDPETGELQWRWNTEPLRNEPGAETWPDETSMRHGGGMTWLPGTYDPDLKLLYWGTGNPNPVYAGRGRRGSNLWTCSIVALHIDSGKLAWYFQASPHDTHDWDNVETPVLIDGMFRGRSRKMLAQAARNGYFFLLDRTDGTSLVSAPFVGNNWASGTDTKGQPVPNPAKEPKLDGALLNIPAGGGTNWMAPSFSPDTGLFYVNAIEGFSLAYLTDTDDKPEGYGGMGRQLWSRHVLKAVDLQTGTVRWQHPYPTEGPGGLGGPGILTTAANLLFSGDPAGNLIAFQADTGRIVWHYRVGKPVSNGPITCRIDGRQSVIVGAGDSLYSFATGK